MDTAVIKDIEGIRRQMRFSLETGEQEWEDISISARKI